MLFSSSNVERLTLMLEYLPLSLILYTALLLCNAMHIYVFPEVDRCLLEKPTKIYGVNTKNTKNTLLNSFSQNLTNSPKTSKNSETKENNKSRNKPKNACSTSASYFTVSLVTSYCYQN